MWIEDLPNGKYKFFERYKDPYTEKLKKVSVTMEKKTPQAKNQAALLLQEKINKKLKTNNVKSVTFGEIYNLFYRQWEKTVKESTKHTYLFVDNIIKKEINNDIFLVNIDRRFIQEKLDKILEEKSYQTATRVRIRLKNIFEYALNYSYIDNNEVTFTSVPKPPATIEEIEQKREKFLTMEEIKKLIDSLNSKVYNQKYGDMVLVLALTGMRYGELVALQLKNIDFQNKKIEIAGNFDSIHKIKTIPKTRKSIRNIKVSEATLEAIKRQIIRLTERFQPLTDDDYIFCFDVWNSPITLPTFSQIIKKYGAIAGIEKNLSSHVFRHSHISYLAEAGLPIKSIMDRVGHANAKMTLEIYSHTTKDMEDKLVKTLDNIF
nr:MAG TPA: Integrase [Caudoviricetes sp.]